MATLKLKIDKALGTQTARGSCVVARLDGRCAGKSRARDKEEILPLGAPQGPVLLSPQKWEVGRIYF